MICKIEHTPSRRVSSITVLRLASLFFQMRTCCWPRSSIEYESAGQARSSSLYSHEQDTARLFKSSTGPSAQQSRAIVVVLDGHCSYSRQVYLSLPFGLTLVVSPVMLPHKEPSPPTLTSGKEHWSSRQSLYSKTGACEDRARKWS